MSADVVAVSQHGYNPEHEKYITYTGTPSPATFSVYNALTNQPVAAYVNLPLTRITGDFGTFWQGRFDQLQDTGDYYVMVGADRSLGSFAIKPHLWDDLAKATAFHYFGLRRLGEDNVVGNFGDFRLVEWNGARTVLGEHKDISNTFADGADGRGYASTSLVLAQYCVLAETNPTWDKGDWIYQQVRWATTGACKFLEKNGTLQNIYLADDHQVVTYSKKLFSHDEKLLTSPDFTKGNTGSEYDMTNREVIDCTLLIGPAAACVQFGGRDPSFFGPVANLVRAGYNTTYNRYYNGSLPRKYSLSTWAWLNILMWKLDGLDVYKSRAVEAVNALLSLQQKNSVSGVKGWFSRSADSSISPFGEKSEQEIMITPWIYQGLIKMVEYLPADPNAGAWREALRSYGEDYLMAVSARNAFGYTPMKAEDNASSLLARHDGNLGYQYFGAIGRQFHQLGNAAYLLNVGRLLGNQKMINAGWKQLYWFSGHNPAGRGWINGFAKDVKVQGFCYDTLGRSFPGGLTNGTSASALVLVPSVTDPLKMDPMTMVPGGYTKVVSDDNPNFDKYNEYYTYANVNVLWFASAMGATQFTEPITLWPSQVKEIRGDPKGSNLYTFGVRMKGGFDYRFGCMVRDDPANGIEWSVSGNTDNIGTIVDGLYSAPFVTTATDVVVTATSTKDRSVKISTPVTIMPVPRQVQDVTRQWVTIANQYGSMRKIRLSWTALTENVAGYAIFKRLPVTMDAQGNISTAGAVWELIGNTNVGVNTYDYPHYDQNDPRYINLGTRTAYLLTADVIKTVTDETMTFPFGTEFMVRAYNLKIDPAFVYPADTGNLQGAGWLANWKNDPNRIYGYGPESSQATFIGGGMPPIIEGVASATPAVVTGTSTSLSILASDDGGESNLVYSWTLKLGPAAIGFSQANSNAAKNATVTFTKPGTYVITCTVTDVGNLSVSSDLTVEVPQTATQLVIAPAVAEVVVGGMQAFTAIIVDQFRSIMPTQPLLAWKTFSEVGGTFDQSGFYAASLTPGGQYQVMATGGGFSAAAVAYTVSAPQVWSTIDDGSSKILRSPGWGSAPDPAAIGGSRIYMNAANATLELSFSGTGVRVLTATAPNRGLVDIVVDGVTVVRDLDCYSSQTGNQVTCFQSTSLSVGPHVIRIIVKGTQNPSALGTYFSLDAFQILTPATAVNLAPVVQVGASASPAVITLGVGGATTLVAALGADDAGEAPLIYTWTGPSGVTFSPNGTNTAKNCQATFAVAGTTNLVVTVTDAQGLSATSSTVVSVLTSNSAPSVVVSATANPAIVTQSTAELSVLGADNGGESAIAYSWTVLSGPTIAVSFSATGSNAAKKTTATFIQSGSYVLQVTLKDAEGFTATSTVPITVSQTASALTISPANILVSINNSQQFSATVTDQFGRVMVSPTLIWNLSVAPNCAISSTGLFSSGSTSGGPYLITASVYGLSSSTAVSVSGASSVWYTIEDNSPLILKKPTALTWTTASDTASSGGTRCYSNAKGAYIECAFTGTDIQVLAMKTNNRGMVDVSIDGVYVGTADNYSSATIQKAVIFTQTGLSDTQHVIRITINGNKNALSVGIYFCLDAIRYQSAIATGGNG